MSAYSSLIVVLFPLAPTISANAIVVSMEQPEGRQFRVVFNKPDESNGPIRLEKEAF